MSKLSHKNDWKNEIIAHHTWTIYISFFILLHQFIFSFAQTSPSSPHLTSSPLYSINLFSFLTQSSPLSYTILSSLSLSLVHLHSPYKHLSLRRNSQNFSKTKEETLHSSIKKKFIHFNSINQSTKKTIQSIFKNQNLISNSKLIKK